MRSTTFLTTAAIAIAASVNAQTVIVDPLPSFTYEADTVRQLQVRNEWGRYITFTGISSHTYQGTSGYTIPGTPPRTTCFGISNTQCMTTPGTPAQFVPGQPGFTERKPFTYELDCRDRTFDRKGDNAGGGLMNGWASVDEDPTALAVANKYCPIISTLPGPAVAATATKAVESDAKEDKTDWTQISSDDEGTFWGIFLRKNGNIAVIREAYVYDDKKKEDENEYFYSEYDCKGSRHRKVGKSDVLAFNDWESIKKGSIAEAIQKFACTAR